MDKTRGLNRKLYGIVNGMVVGTHENRICMCFGIKCVTVTHRLLRIVYVGRYAVT